MSRECGLDTPGARSSPRATRPANKGPELLVGFTRALRSAGVPVTGDRVRSYLEAVRLVGVDDRRATYAAGRATLCGTPTDLDRYDAVFAAWFGGSPKGLPVPGPTRPSSGPRIDLASLLDRDPDAERESDQQDSLRAAASSVEVLRHRDVADMSEAEREQLAAMLDRLTVRPTRRRTPRLRPAPRGRVDAARTMRASLRQLGEPGRIAWRHHGVRHRRVVLLVDVSGSMSPYAEVLLRLAHRLTRSVPAGSGGVETFTVGTRLTQLTRALAERDPERALVAAGETVPDWAGGTRLGETLEVFADRWRSLARGAVVVICSDGWERGDPALLGEQTARITRLAHRTVWVNPHRGKAGYQPVQGGIRAVLPHVDDFLAGHSLATYAELMEVIGSA